VYFQIGLIAFVVDRLFGEFENIKKYKHPVIYLGEFIKWLEGRLYDDSIKAGAVLWGVVVVVAFGVGLAVDSLVDNVWIEGFIASTAISSKMLKDEVQKVIYEPSHIRYLVSRDTQELSSSDINKAAIETYAENLSDGVVAPLMYLVFFGLKGAFVYKAINTLDSMVGYKNDRYKNFGFFSAKADDIANFIPARVTALLIGGSYAKISKCAKLHESPNAGYPICAMAYKLGVKLGGDTKYFGKLKKKPYFGDGRVNITKYDISKALSFATKYDIILIMLLIGLSLI
jgi:adenosylcobinamide-phosphate synthase